jgi:hypothetical protein
VSASLRRIETVSEWAEVTLPGVRLAAGDVKLARRLRDEQRVDVEELRDGLRICARSWVGVVVFEAVEIRIEPKLAGDRLDLLALIDFAHGIDALERSPGELRLTAPDDNLLDLCQTTGETDPQTTQLLTPSTSGFSSPSRTCRADLPSASASACSSRPGS